MNTLSLQRTVLPLAILTLLGLIQGCTTPRTDPEPRLDRIESSLRQTSTMPATVVTPPPAVEAALLAPIKDDLARLAPSKMADRFDVAVYNAPAREFFMGLVQGTPYNMVVHPDVQGSIDLELKGVTIDEVLSLVRASYGYEYEKDGLNYVVLPPRLQTRLFQVNYLNVNRGGQSGTQVNSGQVSQNLRQTTSSTAVAGTMGGTGTSGRAGTNSPYGSQIHTQSQSDYWRELAASLCTLIGLPLTQEQIPVAGSTRSISTPLGCNGALLTDTQNTTNTAGQGTHSVRSGETRSIVISPQSGLVIARALPYELREIERYLKQSESSVQRQVILEAKLIEVELNDGFQSGINWSALRYWNGGNNGLLLGQTGGGTLLNTGKSEIIGNTGILNPDARQFIEGTTASAFGGMFAATLATRDFTAFIELLKSQGNVQVLSSPRVSTLNNQKAVIKVGSDEYFVTGVSSTSTSTAAGTSVVPDIQLTPFFSGIALDVTPQINENEVVLHIHPIVTEVVNQTKEFTIFNQTQRLPLAFSKVREADSIVRAKNGQVIVIGGLMEDAGKLNNASLPGLGDIPGLGELFKHRKNSTRKTELVILLRPVVVNGDEDWRQEIDTTRERIQNLRAIDKANQTQLIE
ncbi:MAG: pilus (MSHA type) biogenesis protein MshL [Gammaproteobacteria bacterium]|nr:pilus (MSHA type) biogenesis protein MshL [Gammaproteobacteria bacterium]